MFQVKSIVLTAALFGHASATIGCYSTYINGGSYSRLAGFRHESHRNDDHYSLHRRRYGM